MRVVAHHSVEELQGIASKERHARKLIRLRIVILAMQGRAAPEIAEVLEIPAGTVRSRIARGRGQLADRLGGNQSAPDERPTPTP